ncbi:MAG: saccharopine dehydrogenase family protein [Deltaproteobacteria bacterium]|nr:MAG: saccharopine dehydrogenase family protein [Deltaproteobacteria bacterium]
MNTVVIVGAGGVGSVVAHKCAQVPEVFDRIVLASRTLERCEKVRDSVARRTGRSIEIERIDANDVPAVVDLLRRVRPRLLLNLALPYQDLPLMDACLEAGVDYLDTANYEPPDEAKFEYKWQWAYHDRFAAAGRMALLGSGFDPGVTNVFCAYARKHLFDEIETIDILDCNAGDHGHPFATNFNPEINIREVTANGRYYEDGAWKETPPLSETMEFDFPEIGPRKAYLMYHEELESLARHLPGVRRMRFWMTFGDAYLTHLRVLENVGMTSIEPVEFEGHKIVPLQFLKALLPDPASLAENYTGKTCIGCLIEGTKDGRRRRVFVYNVCDHRAAYEEVGSQAISYTTGVPAMVGAKMMLSGTWRGEGVFNMEQFDPDPFLEDLARHGLPWHIEER